MEEKSTAYKGAWWLPSPHGQTVAGRLLRRPEPVVFDRERVDTPDGDFLDLDIVRTDNTTGPVVLLMHGLEGSARRGYAIETYRALADRGMRAVGLNFRSCSGELNRTARFYHSGDTDDIRFVADLMARRFPDAPLAAVGFSLGGNALLKFLGEEGEAAGFSAAVAISVPYDLAAGADILERSAIGRFYTRLFVKSLLAKATAKGSLLRDVCDLDRVKAARTFREFDDAATAPIHGFAGAQDYYDRSSSSGFIEHIRIPTLLIHSEDDPFLPFSSFPTAAIAANPAVSALITKTGGHVGFIEGSPLRPRFWAETQAARFLAERLRSTERPR